MASVFECIDEDPRVALVRTALHPLMAVRALYEGPILGEAAAVLEVHRDDLNRELGGPASVKEVRAALDSMDELLWRPFWLDAEDDDAPTYLYCPEVERAHAAAVASSVAPESRGGAA